MDNVWRWNEVGHYMEKRCSKCRDWWPADNEFFSYTSSHGQRKLGSWCKACVLEYKKYPEGKVAGVILYAGGF